MEKNNSNKGFLYSIINLILFVLMFTGHLILQGKSELYMTLIGYLCFIIITIAIIGLIYSLKGIQEQNSAKKIIALILNGIFTFGFISMLIMTFTK
ncbi:hypothetical protein WFZ85_15060 [Flavobacterium sp. j3]|uniref:Uncharacterized protein n=1 Tax=Flavobacterium aureirubrum TaxID=3133147 RepID=A0ABU9N905_9FLAO